MNAIKINIRNGSICLGSIATSDKYNGKSGYKVVLVQLDKEGKYLNQEDFISGWLSNEDAWGRPAAPFVMSDGSLLISDDKYNVIYRVTYKG